MRVFSTILFGAIWIIPVFCYSQIAVLGEPLRKEYRQSGPGYNLFYQTGEFVDSYSMVCDMGQAIPDPKKEDWFVNKRIYGLKLELRARAAMKTSNNGIKPFGFVVVTKENDVLITFTPIGDYVDGRWEGDTFNSWSGKSTDIKVYSERFGRTGYAHFDLLDGNGFFYKSSSRQKPEYFLSNCKRIKKTGLPVYDWKYIPKKDSDAKSSKKQTQ